MAANSVKGALIRRRTGAIFDCPDDTAGIRNYGDNEIPSLNDYPVVDLRGYVTHVYEQGDLGSCTTNAICTAYGLLLQIQARELNHVYYDFNLLTYLFTTMHLLLPVLLMRILVLLCRMH